jgi:NAD(P)-dependent dehydrogenase (short-subunit alcohol dehydrogenase family)
MLSLDLIEKHHFRLAASLTRVAREGNEAETARLSASSHSKQRPKQRRFGHESCGRFETIRAALPERGPIMGRLEGKVALITGAGNGIGREAALLFAREGAGVGILEINAEAGEATRRAIEAEGGKAIACCADVSDPDGVAAAVAATVEKFGRLDVLYNNAGGSSPTDGSVVNASLDEFWRAIRLDLFGTWVCSRSAIPEMLKTGGGSVINTISNVALMGIKNLSAYSASKGGVASLTRAMAVDFAPTIRVNAIAPSVTLTDRLIERLKTNPSVQKMAEQHLVGLGEPIDVAQAALYLASNESKVVTGQIIRVDSGITIN